ncbi:putative receptor-like protein kinase At5g61350 isoform X2 [Bidens hawaiensis]|uniref:putative receptor-like protein kinase At5g61350 isoform X2 n=1 Tax=Bidens hawaiensis TaxID=980011 RepID=UPI00404B332A
MGLAAIARRRFNEGTLKELIDPKLVEEDDGHIFTLNRGPNNNSFHKFSKIAYKCLAETQAKRPMMDDIIKKLQKALKLQGDSVVLKRFLPDDIVLATGNFGGAYRIGLDKNGTVYEAELDHFGNDSSSATEGKSNREPSKKRIIVAIKHITSRKGEHKRHGFFEELEMRAYNHPNIVPLLGLCEKGDEMILVYEHASSRSLNDYLTSGDKMDTFTWTHRLRICLEIARGLNHLQAKMADQNIIRTDIRSANIMLNKNGEAKIGYFVISKLHPTDEGICMKVYEDPEYDITHTLETKSDIYSFGVVLFEIFCGRVAYDEVYTAENNKGLVPIAHQCFKDGTIKRIMDPKLKEDISTGPNQNSVDIFLKVAYQCSGEALKRPTMEMVIKELERALNFRDPQADVESR